MNTTLIIVICLLVLVLVRLEITSYQTNKLVNNLFRLKTKNVEEETIRQKLKNFDEITNTLRFAGCVPPARYKPDIRPPVQSLYIPCNEKDRIILVNQSKKSIIEMIERRYKFELQWHLHHGDNLLTVTDLKTNFSTSRNLQCLNGNKSDERLNMVVSDCVQELEKRRWYHYEQIAKGYGIDVNSLNFLEADKTIRENYSKGD